RYVHRLAGVSEDGGLVAYLSNARNGVDFDLWLVCRSSGERRLLYASGGYCVPASGFSPGGRFVSILRLGARPLDTDLLLVEVATGESRLVLAHPDEAALVGAPAWVDETQCFVSSNLGRDFAAVVRYDVERDEAEDAVVRDGDSEPRTSTDGATLLVVENRGGESHLELFDSASLRPLGEILLPEPGVAGFMTRPPLFGADALGVFFTLTTPRLPGDVFCHDRTSGMTRRLTVSPAPLQPEELVQAERAEVTSFDGEAVPLYLYRPRRTERSATPVVVLVHGGPEAQAMLSFNPIVQGLVGEGLAVVVPNVRGSTGYGKRYASLDDTRKRLDSVRDLAAVHGFLGRAGLDASRAVLWGGSYGGYMVLAGLAFQPELWAAGVDLVGISDLVTFLTNTSAYRRAAREREYGSLEHDRDFLEAASPLRRAEEIRAPLFVVHGRNDPRVPVSEAEQLVATLRQRGLRCELVIYDDEGHGLARLANRLDAYPRAATFLHEVLAPER
ncbi:MAG TPA: S9 family peptidase, partial [Acidimicrobiales bacterium]|nr:S9 family peptidase [Acidimicrobiales bacterium]